jgi:hypothetical protein
VPWAGVLLAGGKSLVCGDVVLDAEADLTQMILTLRAAGGLARRLNRWQQQGNEDANNGNHDEQFDESKCSRELHQNSLPREGTSRTIAADCMIRHHRHSEKRRHWHL